MAGKLDKFARSFASLTTDSLKSEKLIDFKCEVPLLSPLEVQKLFVRPCYVDLAVLLIQESSSNKRRQFIVSGTPGVGKSFFGVYMLVKLFKEEGAKTVYYQCKAGGSSKRYIFSMNDDQLVPHATQIYERISFERSLDESPRGTWYIVDGMVPYFVTGTNTLLITSPNWSVWHKFLKQSVEAIMYYVPIWKLDELLKCHELMYHDVLSEKEVEEHFDKWGGLFRYVLCSAKAASANEDRFDGEIASADINSFMRAIGNMEGKEDNEKMSHKLIHFKVHDDAGITERYERYHLAPASSYVFNKLAAVFIEKKRQEVMMFLKYGSYTDGNDPTSTLRGHLFEGLAHQHLIKGGEFSVRSLKSEHTEEIVIEPASVENRFPGKSIPSQLEAGAYYRPISSNFPAIDAFRCCQNNEVILFQITIATSHTIAHQELKDMIISLESQNYKVRRFYFVVDEGGFSSYTLQKYHTKDKEYVKCVDTRVQAVEQYALRIPLGRVLSAIELASHMPSATESAPPPTKTPRTDI